MSNVPGRPASAEPTAGVVGSDQAGRLEVIAGCMFAGKTAELIRRLTDARDAGLRVAAFKHRLDARYHAVELATHNGRTFPATAVASVDELREAFALLPRADQSRAQVPQPSVWGTDERGESPRTPKSVPHAEAWGTRASVQSMPPAVIGIDEAQFFGEPLVELCHAWIQAGVRVIVTGIDFNIRGREFAPFPQLKAMAAEVTILHTPCDSCGGPGRYSQRLTPIANGNMVGGRGDYSPRCERCFEQWTAEIPA